MFSYATTEGPYYAYCDISAEVDSLTITSPAIEYVWGESAHGFTYHCEHGHTHRLATAACPDDFTSPIELDVECTEHTYCTRECDQTAGFFCHECGHYH